MVAHDRHRKTGVFRLLDCHLTVAIRIYDRDIICRLAVPGQVPSIHVNQFVAREQAGIWIDRCFFRLDVFLGRKYFFCVLYCRGTAPVGTSGK